MVERESRKDRLELERSLCGYQADEMDKLTKGQKKRKVHMPERRWQGDTWPGRGTGRVMRGGDRDEKGVERS